MGNGQRQARQPRAGSKVGPAFPWLRASNCGQAEGVIQVSLPEPLLFPRPQEPEPDGGGVSLLQDLRVSGRQGGTPLRPVALGRMFHVKRYVGRITTRR